MVVTLLTMVAALLLTPLSFGRSSVSRGGSGGQRKSVTRQRTKVAPAKVPRVDYAKFSHRTHVGNQKLACVACHQFPSKNWKDVRKGEAAFADIAEFPDHSACLSCHRGQFFARERPAPVICSNCHVANSPRNTSRWLFPSLGDVTDPAAQRRSVVPEFGVAFPHDKHLEVVGFNGSVRERNAFVLVSLQKPAEPPKSCPVCHATYQPQGKSGEEYVTPAPKTLGDNFWLKKGTFKTIPNSHAVCFTCHNAESGIAPDAKDCHVCHQLLAPDAGLKTDFAARLIAEMGITDAFIVGRWSKRISAGAFRHEGGAHPDLNCLSCHDVAAFYTVDPKTMRVPVRSCGGADGCHITATVDDGGIMNFEIAERQKNPAFICTKCHVVLGKEALPADHPAAIPTPAPKKQS
ncbi:MAG: hypothetical protein QOD33_1753 [Pyrinomonadaceae bacterium]|nr:hypothetical protein [Pyrinomonadaceae bacterium]